MSCTNMTDKATGNQVSREKLEWFENGNWHHGFNASPDSTVNIVEFYEHYSNNTELWQKVFDYLANADFQQMETGKTHLAGDSLFLIVDEYSSQHVSERKYESHRKYIDLQYVVKGEEYIGLVNLNADLKVDEPYDKVKDIMFYGDTDGDYRLADSTVFFIFFPDDVHQPCVKVDQSIPIKKIVFKILLK